MSLSRHNRSYTSLIVRCSHAADGLPRQSAVGVRLSGLIKIQTCVSSLNSNFLPDKPVRTSVTRASSAPVLHPHRATSFFLYFDGSPRNVRTAPTRHCTD